MIGEGISTRENEEEEITGKWTHDQDEDREKDDDETAGKENKAALQFPATEPWLMKFHDHLSS